MGALSEALAKAAAGAGVAIRTHSEVRRILVDDDRAVGVELSNGERIGGRSVISNADPKTTFLKLLGAAQLDTGFVRRVHHVRGNGLAAKLHIALKRPPLFAGATEAQLRGRLVLAPSLEYVEHAYNHSKYGEYSAQPALEVTVPTANDASLAPGGHHVMSVVAQYAPYALRGGWTEAARQGFTNAILDQLEALAPGLRESIAAVQLLTPFDLEASFGMSGGHWHHGDLAFDQFLMVRPVPGAAQYRTPLPGLYLCGAGCHPGGGVMGVAGRNAAAQVLKGAA
jgi:phytoene dehydrogenase-like protein